MTVIRCRACSVWEPFETDGRERYNPEASGWCRRFAPRPVADGTLNGQVGELHFSSPIRMNSEGCYEGIPDPWVWP